MCTSKSFCYPANDSTWYQRYSLEDYDVVIGPCKMCIGCIHGRKHLNHQWDIYMTTKFPSIFPSLAYLHDEEDVIFWFGKLLILDFHDEIEKYSYVYDGEDVIFWFGKLLILGYQWFVNLERSLCSKELIVQKQWR